MICLLYRNLFLHLDLIEVNRLTPQDNCSVELKPLLDTIPVLGKVAQPIDLREQLPVEYDKPTLNVIPCDSKHFREDLDTDRQHHIVEADKHLKNPDISIDLGCSCSYIHHQWWKPDQWTNITENKLQQQTQGYVTVMLNRVRTPQEKFTSSHINHEESQQAHIYGNYSQDHLAFTEYIIAAFVERYQWTAWKLFFDDKSYPESELDPCYILLKDMPNVKSIKYNNSTSSPRMAENLKECDPRRLVTTEIKDEHDVTVTITGGAFSPILPNINNIAHLHDRLYFKWNWNDWINKKIRLGPIRKRHIPIWWILRRSQTTVLRIKITICSQSFLQNACENLDAISERSALCYLQPILHLSKKSSWPPL